MMSSQHQPVFCAGQNRSTALRFVALLAISWAVFFAAYSLFLHAVFRSTSLDLALHSQLLWNLQHGRFMQTSFLPYSFAGNHFWPGFYLLVPFYQWCGSHGMLVLQSVVIAAGAFPAYLLARDITKSEAWGLALALAYLLQPTLSSGVLFDYHLELFSVPFALLALLGLRRDRLWFWPCMLLAWSFYEINAAVFFFLGLGLLLSRGRRRVGALIALSSLVYLAVIVGVVMPHFQGGARIPHWERYAHLGSTPVQAVAAVLLHPFRSVAEGTPFKDVIILRYLFASFGCLSLLSLKHFLPAVPLLLALVLSNWSVNTDLRFGYVAPVLPFLFLSAAHGAAALDNYGWLKRFRLATRGPYVLAACSLVLFVYFQVKMPLRSQPFAVRANLAALRHARGMIPPEASLSADNHLGAHFADRETLLVTPATRRGSQAVEFVFTDLNETEFKDSNWWFSMQDLLLAGDYGPVWFTNGALVLQKGVKNEALAGLALERITAQTRVVPAEIRNQIKGGTR